MSGRSRPCNTPTGRGDGNKRHMKKTILLTAAALTLAGVAADAESSAFLPKHLAVLRAGDGVLDLHLRQAPAFIDEFTPGSLNAGPSFTVAIPTNGPDTLFFNGHAATEGVLTRSADHHLLAMAGYGGVNLLQTNGTPSLLDIARVFCTVDAGGKVRTMTYRKTSGVEKMNPRGMVTDGTNHFWGCGNALGTIYYGSGGSGEPVAFVNAPNSRAVKIIDNALYVTLNGPDGAASDLPAGIFSFLSPEGQPVSEPHEPGSKLKVAIAAKTPYTKVAGFDMNEDGTIAYTADTAAGIQKYVKSGGAWKFAYNFSIPQNISGDLNRGTGCFGVAVDFSGMAPVIYATTSEGYDGCANSNRVVQIVDTNSTAVVTTVAQSPSVKIAYRGIDFTPEP
jgi:hypothetical protein